MTLGLFGFTENGALSLSVVRVCVCFFSNRYR